MKDFHFSEFKEGAYSLIQFARGSDDEPKTYGQIQKTQIASGAQIPYKEWGRHNDLPKYREDLLCGSNIVLELIKAKRDITIGAGLYAYRRHFEDGKMIKEMIPLPAEAEDFIGRCEEEDYFEKAGGQYMMHANIFTQLIPTKGGKVYSLKCSPCRHVRAGAKKQDDHPTTFLVGAVWDDLDQTLAIDQHTKQDVRPFSAIRKAQDWPEMNRATLMMHTGDQLLRPDGYYYTPAYWGGENWITLANAIPLFHKNNLLNSYSIKYHIEIPENFFEIRDSEQISQMAPGELAEAEKNAREQLIQDLNEFLAGAHNAGRAFYSSYQFDQVTKTKFPGIIITPLKVDLLDDKLLALFDKSNQANISAQGVPPSLAAIETPGKLGSGSEIRNAFLMYTALKAPQPRKTLLKPLNLVKKINGWAEDVHFGFLDMEIQTLDENPQGMAPAQSNQVPE